MTAVIMT